jgi:hypothetical protein
MRKFADIYVTSGPISRRYSEDSSVDIGCTAIKWASTVREEEQFYYKPNLNILQRNLCIN